MGDTKPEPASAAESTELEPEVPKKKSEIAPTKTASSPTAGDESAQSSTEKNTVNNEPEKSTPSLETKFDEKVVSSEPIKEEKTSEKLVPPKPKSSENDAESDTGNTAATERKQSSASEKEETKQCEKSKEPDPSEEKQRKQLKEIEPNDERLRKKSKEVETKDDVQRKKSKEVEPNDEKQRKTSKELETKDDVQRKKSKEVEPNDEKLRKTSKEVETKDDAQRKKSKEIEPSDEKLRKTSKEVPTNDDAQRKKSKEIEPGDELQDMIKEIAESKTEVKSGQTDDKKEPLVGKETTENLISVLEDDMEGQTKENPSKEPAAAASVAATTSEDAAPPVKPPKPKKYLYKLKSKTGKILHYTSTVPITLKRPIIHLTKMPDTSSKPDPVRKVIGSEKEDVDSDNSAKENNVKENEAPNDNVMRVVRKKGRPPLSSRPPPPVITLDGNASDTSEEMRNKSATSFSMQTRKRQLKFLPDGRLVTPQKRIKTGDKNESMSSSDSDIDIISDGEKSADSTAANKISTPKKPEISIASISGSAVTSAVPAAVSIASTSTNSIAMPKKFKPGEAVKTNNSLVGEKRKYKKIFDYESYYREKTGIPSQSALVRTPIGNRSFASNLTPIRKVGDTPKLKPILPSNSATPKKSSSVDPAQLLSSLIGVPITSSQLNVVKFKPKIIQERTNTIIASTPKKVTFEDDRNTKYPPAHQSELLKSTPFKIVSKPTYQKILPKPTGVNRMPMTQTRMAYQPINIENKLTSSSNSLFIASTAPFMGDTLQDTLAKFETFTDSKVVKTKEGPKRAVKRKLDEDVFLKDNNTKTLYDLMYEIFEKMPSWNLHVVPDTNCFCIAQVSRGRMGIPTLKKSIEINSEFFAKVYVHQLQCKRYDGIYDTESKIVKLIKEIDALAA